MEEATFTVVSSMTTHQLTYTGPIPRVSPSRTALAPAAKRRVKLWFWSPRGLQDRGLTASREQERAYRDLQAAASVADWR
jgi:hypothetical protein